MPSGDSSQEAAYLPADQAQHENEVRSRHDLRQRKKIGKLAIADPVVGYNDQLAELRKDDRDAAKADQRQRS